MRVLVVEDDPALAVFLQKGLMLEGHEVERVGDGDAALEMAAQQAPDLVGAKWGTHHTFITATVHPTAKTGIGA